MSSEKDPKCTVFMHMNVNCITIIITLEGIEKIKTKQKEDNETVSEIFLYQQRKETATNTVMAWRFLLAVYVVQLFDSHFSLGYLLKYILAQQIIHHSS